MGIGTDTARVDGIDKLVGRAEYVDDLNVPGVWHGGVVRSTVPRGRIKAIRFDPAIDWDEFAIVDHRDIPGRNVVHLIEDDQPVLAVDEIRHKHEPILLLAHPSIRQLRRGLRGVTIDIEPLPALLDPEAEFSQELVQFGDDNVFKRIDIEKGSTADAFAGAAHIVEGCYRTGSQEHIYLETNGMLAEFRGDRLRIHGSMQCPYYVVEALRVAMNMPRESLQVVPAAIGGGFGGKEEYPSGLAIHAALLSRKAKAPVKIIFHRGEDMAVSTKRHPAVVGHRTALDDEGRLCAMEIDVILDGGAFMTLSPVVLSRAAIHAAGPYRCDHIHIHAEARLTNSPPYGAFRGFGAPQTLFAMERHMDEIARALDIDPIELRRRNLLRDGDTTATGQVFDEHVDLARLMDDALAHADYQDKQIQHRKLNTGHAYLRRGIGCSSFFHGAGFTGAGEVHLESEVWTRALPDGRIEVLTSQTDMGQGTSTILAQVAAEAVGLPDDRVVVANADTSRVPNSGPTVASRSAMVVGSLVAQACVDLVRNLGDASLRGDALIEAIESWQRKHPGEELRGRAKYVKSDRIVWDDEKYRGDAYATYSWATHCAEVEVDLRTWSVKVIDYVALQDVGRVLNPTLARGQIAGGVVQGIGWALTEDVLLEDGAMKNAQMTNYIIPVSGDLPPIRVYFQETPVGVGPGGVKGIGELPMDGPAPAIVNAICNAIGKRIDFIPITPERLMAVCEEGAS